LLNGRRRFTIGNHQPDPEQTQMTKRITRKSTALPVKQTATAAINYVRELPGAVFFGVPRRHFYVTDRTGATHEVDATSITSIDRESLDYAIRLQRIRSEYENDAILAWTGQTFEDRAAERAPLGISDDPSSQGSTTATGKEAQ
jgi:hypothetical protein